MWYVVFGSLHFTKRAPEYRSISVSVRWSERNYTHQVKRNVILCLWKSYKSIWTKCHLCTVKNCQFRPTAFCLKIKESNNFYCYLTVRRVRGVVHLCVKSRARRVCLVEMILSVRKIQSSCFRDLGTVSCSFCRSKFTFYKQKVRRRYRT